MNTTFTINENEFKDILNGMVDGVITINQKGIVLTFNKTAETIFGYKATEVVGKNVSMLMPEPEHSAHDTYLNNHIKTGVEHIIGIGRDVSALRKNGNVFPMHLSVTEYPAKIKGERWFIGSCRDVTLQKQQEEQLKRSLKMDAIGKLTSGIAHDYNNMVGVILGFSELLTENVENSSKCLEYITHIRQAAERAANLTSQLLSLTRKSSDAEERVDISDMLKDNQQLISKTLTSQIKLSINTDENLWSVFVEKGCLEDSLLNLCINAMHAMPEGGELVITASNSEIGSLDSRVLNIKQGDYVKLAISDNGIGMTDEVISHIFEPFYSTKGGRGTGLGLSQVFNFVNKSEGTVKVYSEPGYGTCFSVYLPRSLGESSANSAKNIIQIETDELKGLGRILIVDDEKALLELSKTILSTHGYEVCCVSNAKEALALLENEYVDLVLSDVIMPEMDGFELSHVIRHKYPQIKIQLYSGFENIKGKSVTNKVLADNLLTKPFTANQLLMKVQELLKH